MFIQQTYQQGQFNIFRYINWLPSKMSHHKKQIITKKYLCITTYRKSTSYENDTSTQHSGPCSLIFTRYNTNKTNKKSAWVYCPFPCCG